MATKRYYEDLGRSHDMVMRCKDCRELVTYKIITKIGCCNKCGNKRFSEVTLLTEIERDRIEHGDLDFPDKELFLREFAAVPEDAA